MGGRCLIVASAMGGIIQFAVDARYGQNITAYRHPMLQSAADRPLTKGFGRAPLCWWRHPNMLLCKHDEKIFEHGLLRGIFRPY